MRLDKFLKVSRIIKRRTVANSAASSDKIYVNGNISKPGKDIKVGDIITINYFKKMLKIKVLSVDEKTKASDAEGMYEIIELKENN